MKTYCYDIRLSDDHLPMLVKECVVNYRASMRHTCPGEISDWLYRDMGMSRLTQEKLVGIFYDKSMRMIGYSEITTGTVDASLAPPRETYQRALALGATGIIVAHNHPSGISDPSSEDKDTLKRFREAGKMIGIDLLDFLIVGNETYWSGAENGYFKE